VVSGSVAPFHGFTPVATERPRPLRGLDGRHGSRGAEEQGSHPFHGLHPWLRNGHTPCGGSTAGTGAGEWRSRGVTPSTGCTRGYGTATPPAGAHVLHRVAGSRPRPLRGLHGRHGSRGAGRRRFPRVGTRGYGRPRPPSGPEAEAGRNRVSAVKVLTLTQQGCSSRRSRRLCGETSCRRPRSALPRAATGTLPRSPSR
jgi:hypothetical protein